MKVVLSQDVDSLGDRGQILNVAPGFARNYLIPKGLALEATPGNLRTLELRKKVWSAREARETEGARDLASRIAAIRISISKKVGENNTLYGSVTSSEIADLLEKQGVQVDRRKILLAEPIKAVGDFQVPIRIHRQVTAEVSVQVIPEVD